MTRSLQFSPGMTEIRAHQKPRSSDYLVDWQLWAFTILSPLILMVFIAVQPWIDPGMLLRDPLAVAEMSANCCKVYYGAVSNLGVLLWTSGAAICLFSAVLLYAFGNQVRSAVFFLSAGLLTGFLALDDLFLVHENVLPALGVPEPVTYAGYGFLGLIYLGISWRKILDNRYWLLIVAIGLLSISVTIDWIFHSDHPMRILLEDGTKIGGIFAWTAFHVTAAASEFATRRNAWAA